MQKPASVFTIIESPGGLPDARQQPALSDDGYDPAAAHGVWDRPLVTVAAERKKLMQLAVGLASRPVIVRCTSQASSGHRRRGAWQQCLRNDAVTSS
jgi:hypothetical protein